VPTFGEAERRTGERPLRVGEALRHALAKLLGSGALRDPALEGASITVSEVKVSADLRNAIAYVIPLGGEKAAETLAALKRGAAFLKGRLAREVGLRHVPGLTFALDPSFDRAERINALLARPEVARDLQSPQTEAEQNPEGDKALRPPTGGASK
jgi:ribosome-binding factor A